MRKHIIPTALCFALLLACAFPAAASFNDVRAGQWFFEAVSTMEDEGFLKGYEDGSFRPDNPISAAEFVTVAARMAGLSPAQGQVAHWASATLEGARRAGWYDWDEIPPTGERFDKPIMRQLAVKILMAALLPDASGDYNTESVKMRDFDQLDGRYYSAVFAAYASGVVVGDNKGNFNPKSGLSRAEACMLFTRARNIAGLSPTPSPAPTPTPDKTGGAVSKYGWLQVKGTQLCSQSGQPVVLRGMSTHGLQWYGQYASKQAIQNTVSYGANVFRVAMYTDEGGYLSGPETMKQKLIAAVDTAIECGVYVIIDWHILSDGDPSAHTAEAVAFFTEMAMRYADEPAVIYEICNEPNGNITWAKNVKPYAETVTAAIRAWAPRSVVLIGTPTWSQDVDAAAADPLDEENLMYTLHFYAGTHGAWLRERLDKALGAGLPVFVSEWGLSRADGAGGVFTEEGRQWLDFLNQRQISWCNWSLCDKGESAAALYPGTAADQEWTAADLSESGKFVFGHFTD